MASGRHFFLQAENEQERNEWIAHINYASAFKTAGIRMRLWNASDENRMRLDTFGAGVDDGQPALPLKLHIPQSTIGLIPTNGVAATVLSNNSPYTPDALSGAATSTEGVFNGLQSRPRILKAKIQELQTKFDAAKAQLDADMRIVRNLAVLTPFQRSTRDRIQAAVVTVSHSIKRTRLELVKMACHRDVLAADLAAGRREQGLDGDDAHSPSRGVQRQKELPRMTISLHDDHSLPNGSSQSLNRCEAGDDSSTKRPDSSICESFHSALDFNLEWPNQIRTSQSTSEFPGELNLSFPSSERLKGNSSRELRDPPSLASRNSEASSSYSAYISPSPRARGSVSDGQDSTPSFHLHTINEPSHERGNAARQNGESEINSLSGLTVATRKNGGIMNGELRHGVESSQIKN